MVKIVKSIDLGSQSFEGNKKPALLAGLYGEVVKLFYRDKPPTRVLMFRAHCLSRLC